MAYNPLNRGLISKAPTRSLTAGFQNGTLTGIFKGVLVSVDSFGNIAPTDISNELSMSRIAGITNELIASSATGQVVSAGRIEDVTGFSVGDAIYAGKTGLSTSKPDIGVYGFNSLDWVIFIGVIAKNEFDGSKNDIQLFIQVIGQL